MTLEQYPGGTEPQANSIWKIGSRSPVENRQVKNWPPPDIPYDVPLFESDFESGMQFPPERARQRDAHFKNIRCFYRGDYSPWVEDMSAVRVVTPYAFRHAQIKSSILLSAGAPADVIDQLQSHLISAISYGRAYFVRADDAVFVPEPMHVYRAAENPDIRYVISRYVSAESEDGYYDRAYIYAMTPDSGGVIYDRVLDDNVWGAVLGTTTVTGGWSMSDNPPLIDNDWGSSDLVPMIPTVVELALAQSGISYVTRKHENPTAVFPGAEANAQKIARSGQPSDLQGLGPGFVQRATTEATDNSSIWLPDNSFTPSYLEWTGALPASFMHVDNLKDELRMLSGVPGILESFEMGSLSGVAIRELYGPLTWTASPLHERVLAAIEQLVGPVDWPNPFDEAEETVEPDLEVEGDEQAEADEEMD